MSTTKKISFHYKGNDYTIAITIEPEEEKSFQDLIRVIHDMSDKAERLDKFLGGEPIPKGVAHLCEDSSIICSFGRVGNKLSVTSTATSWTITTEHSIAEIEKKPGLYLVVPNE